MAIRINSVSKRFGEFQALQDVSLNIPDGELTALLGPSGSGKSTLLRIVAGLETESAGSVAIDGEAMAGRAPNARDIAMVFQSYALYPHLTVADNIAVPLRMRRMSAAQRLLGLAPRAVRHSIAAEVQAVAAMLRIESLLARKPAQLSGGQKQRVALARAMVRRPRVFLMDEPLSNLDAELRVHMRAEIAQLHRQIGATFVYVTHDQVEAMTMSDRVAVILAGRLQQVASPDTLYRDPDTLAVARFVGTPRINVLPAQRISGPFGRATHVAVRPERLKVFASCSLQISSPPLGGEAKRGGDAHRLQPPLPTSPPSGGEEPEDGGGVLHGQLVHRENLGSDLLLHVDVPGVPDPVIVRADPAAGEGFQIGAALSLAIDPRHALLFDASGKRIRP